MDNIMSTRLLLNKEGGWHKKGTVTQVPMTPYEAAAGVLKDVVVCKLPLSMTYRGQERFADLWQIVRDPLKDVEGMEKDPNGGKDRVYIGDERFAALPPVKFGAAVGNDYALITPQMMVDYVSKAILVGKKPRPVETFGLLGDGSRMFITYQLERFSLQGVDEVRPYLLIYSPTVPGESVMMVISHVRTVCENTFRAAVNGSRVKIIIPHTEGAEKRIVASLKEMHRASLDTADQMKTAIEWLGATRFDADKMKTASEYVYRMPNLPSPVRETKAGFEERMKRYESNVKWVETARTLARNLYEAPELFGDGDYMQPELQGSAYAALQAFGKIETYRRGYGDGRVSNLINGDRSANLDRAFAAVTSLVKA